MSPAILASFDCIQQPTASVSSVLHPASWQISWIWTCSCRRHKSRAARTRNFWFVKSKAICCAAISTNIVCSTGGANFCFLALVRYGCHHQEQEPESSSCNFFLLRKFLIVCWRFRWFAAKQSKVSFFPQLWHLLQGGALKVCYALPTARAC